MSKETLDNFFKYKAHILAADAIASVADQHGEALLAQTLRIDFALELQAVAKQIEAAHEAEMLTPPSGKSVLKTDQDRQLLEDIRRFVAGEPIIDDSFRLLNTSTPRLLCDGLIEIYRQRHADPRIAKIIETTAQEKLPPEQKTRFDAAVTAIAAITTESSAPVPGGISRILGGVTAKSGNVAERLVTHAECISGHAGWAAGIGEGGKITPPPDCSLHFTERVGKDGEIPSQREH